MDSTSESLGVDSDPVRHELPLSRDVASEFPPQFWHDTRKLKVLGMGTALPGRPVTTAELLKLIEDRFDVAVSRRGAALASRLNIVTRHICRDFETRHEAPRPGNSNPDLSAVALRMALEEAQLKIGDLAYLIGHTTSPACLVPPNISLVADRVGFAGTLHGTAASMHRLRERARDRARTCLQRPVLKLSQLSAPRLAPFTSTLSAPVKT